MKKFFVAAGIVFGAAFVTGGCASTNADPNDIPKIDQDTKVYNTGSRIGRPDRAHEPATK